MYDLEVSNFISKILELKEGNNQREKLTLQFYQYSWSISHILEHDFFCLGSSGSKEKKSGFELFWATFEGGFFNFLRAKKKIYICFENIVASALKSCMIYFF